MVDEEGRFTRLLNLRPFRKFKLFCAMRAREVSFPLNLVMSSFSKYSNFKKAASVEVASLFYASAPRLIQRNDICQKLLIRGQRNLSFRAKLDVTELCNLLINKRAQSNVMCPRMVSVD